MTLALKNWPARQPLAFLLLALVAWLALYQTLMPASEALVAALPLERTRALLAFMMSVIALSLPEMIFLRKVLKIRLIATFIGVVASGILLVGYVFNAVL